MLIETLGIVVVNTWAYFMGINVDHYYNLAFEMATYNKHCGICQALLCGHAYQGHNWKLC